MLKLYKKQSDHMLYWETWEDDDHIIVHQGVVGDIGQSHTFPKSKESRQAVKKEVAKWRSEGYAELDEGSLFSITIEFGIEGWPSKADLETRHKIEDLMDDCLGWTGLGHCDGGEGGGGSMSVCCMVVDPYLALKPILEELKKNNCLEGVLIELDPKTDEDDFEVLWPRDSKGEISY